MPVGLLLLIVLVALALYFDHDGSVGEEKLDEFGKPYGFRRRL